MGRTITYVALTTVKVLGQPPSPLLHRKEGRFYPTQSCFPFQARALIAPRATEHATTHSVATEKNDTRYLECTSHFWSTTYQVPHQKKKYLNARHLQIEPLKVHVLFQPEAGGRIVNRNMRRDLSQGVHTAKWSTGTSGAN